MYGGKDLWNRRVLSLEWKREEVMDGVMKSSSEGRKSIGEPGVGFSSAFGEFRDNWSMLVE